MPKLARQERPADREPLQESAEPLFRKEVIEEKQTQWLGAILLEPSRSHSVFARVAMFSIAALLLLFVFGSYTRKVHVSGWLVPKQGLARVFSPQPGVVSRIHAAEGDLVRKGAPLLTISGDTRNEALIATREEVVRHLQLRHDRLDSTRESHRRLFDHQKAEQDNRVSTLETELRFLTREIELQTRRARLAQDALRRETAMRDRGLIPLPRLQRAQQETLDQAARLLALERNRATLARDFTQAKVQLDELPLRANVQFDDIDRASATVQQELAEAEARRSVVLTAPEDGVVTAVQAELGGNVSTTAPLLTIVPENAVLEVHLYSPTKGVGFLRPGQRVYLRFQAYAYQKFGLQEGKVKAVSRSASSAAELPPQLSALASMVSASEPLYRVTVELSGQTVRAYGDEMPLKPNMLVDADVLVEKRRLIEWMFEPLFAISGSLRS